MAYGTETIKKVDKISGRAISMWRQQRGWSFGEVDIDMIARPGAKY